MFEGMKDYKDWKAESLEHLREIKFPASMCSLWDAAMCGVITYPKKMYSTLKDHRGNTYLPFWLVYHLEEAWVKIEGKWVNLKEELVK